jgi:GT2 family glycosyltransferase
MEARKQGYENAKYDFLCYVDDDNWLAKDYLCRAYSLFLKMPQVGLIGGLGTPVFESEKPYWFDRYQSIFAVGPQWFQQGDITHVRGWVNGAGMCLRKSAITLNKQVFLTIGRKATVLSAWEDKEIGLKIVKNGWNVIYNPDMCFFHFIPKERSCLDYLRRLFHGIYSNDFVLDGLSFSAGVKSGWYKKRFKRTYMFLILRKAWSHDLLKHYKILGWQQVIKTHLSRIWHIALWNTKYNRSFK